MANSSVLVSLTKVGGNTVSEDRVLMVNRILSAVTDPSEPTKVLIRYDVKGDSSEILDLKTGTLTLTQFNNAVNDLPTPGAREYIGVFDASAGKAIGSYDFLDLAGNPITIPDNSRIITGFYDVTTTFTSATDAATIAFSIPTDDANGIKAAIAISNVANPYDSSLTAKAIIQDGTVTNASEKTTADRKLQAVVAVEALTAGVLYIWVKVVTTA
jgi:hypothetical protein